MHDFALRALPSYIAGVKPNLLSASAHHAVQQRTVYGRLVEPHVVALLAMIHGRMHCQDFLGWLRGGMVNCGGGMCHPLTRLDDATGNHSTAATTQSRHVCDTRAVFTLAAAALNFYSCCTSRRSVSCSVQPYSNLFSMASSVLINFWTAIGE